MPKTLAINRDPEMLKQYDFSHGVRGKYAERFREGTNMVRLDEDVAAVFPNAKSVNDALRAIADIIRRHEKHGVSKEGF